jgi:dienelactone hydrolase
MHDANADWQLHEYGNAMHAFTNELADAPELGTLYNKDADQRSAKAINNFLDEVFN